MKGAPGAAPPDLTAAPGARRVRKLPIAVAVTFATADGATGTLEGEVRHEAGDAILTGVQGERWPVRRCAFLASYEPVPPAEPGQDGAYVKRPVEALALRLRRATRIVVGPCNDTLRGHRGDWLLQYGDGNYGIVGGDVFRLTYEVVGTHPGKHDKAARVAAAVTSRLVAGQ